MERWLTSMKDDILLCMLCLHENGNMDYKESIKIVGDYKTIIKIYIGGWRKSETEISSVIYVNYYYEFFLKRKYYVTFVYICYS